MFILTLTQYPFFLWMSPHVHINKEHAWAPLFAGNLSMLAQQKWERRRSRTPALPLDSPSSLWNKRQAQAEQKGNSRATGSVHVLLVMGSRDVSQPVPRLIHTKNCWCSLFGLKPPSFARIWRASVILVLYNKWGWTVHMVAYSFRIYLVGPLWLSPPDTTEDSMSILAGIQLLMHLCTVFSLQRNQLCQHDCQSMLIITNV